MKHSTIKRLFRVILEGDEDWVDPILGHDLFWKLGITNIEVEECIDNSFEGYYKIHVTLHRPGILIGAGIDELQERLSKRLNAVVKIIPVDTKIWE